MTTRKRMRNPRVFIGLTEVAGYFGNLAQGLREIGVPVTLVDQLAHPFEYRHTTVFSRLGSNIELARTRSHDPHVGRLGRCGWWVAALVLRIFKQPLRVGLFLWAVSRHDAFIFGAADSLLPAKLDLHLLRWLGKRTIWVFTGSDHRPPYLNGQTVRKASDGRISLRKETNVISKRVASVERLVDCVIGLPASAHFHTRPIFRFLAMGIPFPPPAAVPASVAHPFVGQGVRILHSPSDPIGKGSDRVREVIGRLKERGHLVDYVEIVRRPHREVLAALQSCDLVIDEVYSDTPMAVLAAEAAHFGKPVVVTGYYADLAREDIRAEEMPPTLFQHPDDLEEAIERMVVDEAYRRDLGRRAQRFVREKWSASTVARRYLRLINGDEPAEWLWDPARQRYLHGWGMSEAQVQSALRGLLSGGATHELALPHNPSLVRRFATFADAASPIQLQETERLGTWASKP